MKKNILGALFFSLISSQTLALSEVEISGEMDINGSLWSLPTGERGDSSFAMPSLFLNFEVPLQESNYLVMTLEGSEEKSSSVERFDLKVREAYLDILSFFSGMQGLRMGLIPQPWQEAQYEIWSYRFLGTTAWAMTEKWKYLNYSDLGFSYMTELADDFGEWAFTLTNGEGGQNKEEGPRKEAALFLRLNLGAAWTTSFNYVYGSHEKFDAEISKKERIQALITYHKGSEWLVGLELLKARDPADALHELSMAEQVDVTNLMGKKVVGQAASLFTVIGVGVQSELMLRYDYLNAVDRVTGKDLRTALVAWGYQATEDLRGSLSVDHTEYGNDFSIGARDRSKVEIAAQVLF